MKRVFLPALTVVFFLIASRSLFAQALTAPAQTPPPLSGGTSVQTPRAVPVPVNPAAETYNSAIKNFKAGHIDEAISELRDYLNAKPDDSSARGLLGYLELRQGQDPDQATADLRLAVKLNPSDLPTRNNYASALLEQKRYADAIPQLKIVAAAVTTDLRSQARLGGAYAEVGDFANALPIFQKLSNELNPPAPVVKNYALTLAHLNKFAEAAKQYDRAATIDPSDVGSWTSAGMLYSRIGKEADAARCLGESLKLGPTDPFRTRFMYATALAETGHPQDAIKQFKYVTVIKPDEFAAWYDLALLEDKEGMNDDAISSYKQANQLDPENLPVLENMSALMIKTGDPTDAVSALAAPVKANPASAPLHVLLGAAYIQTNDSSDAISEWNDALAIAPGDIDTRVRLAQIYSAAKDWPNALAQYGILVKLKPTSDEFLTQQGETLLEMKRYPEAIVALQSAIEINPKNAAGWNNLGASHEQLKQYTAALADYKKASLVDPAMTEAKKNYARLVSAEAASSGSIASPPVTPAPAAHADPKPASTDITSPAPTPTTADHQSPSTVAPTSGPVAP